MRFHLGITHLFPVAWSPHWLFELSLLQPREESGLERSPFASKLRLFVASLVSNREL